MSALPFVVGAGDENENPPELLAVVVAGDPKLNPDEELVVAAPVPNLNPPPAPIVMTAAAGLAASFSFLTSSS